MIASDKVQKSLNVMKLSMVTAFSLAIVKVLVAILTNSMAILSSALDSIMDVGTSGVNFIAMKEASKPPDEEHAYGHGKIASLAGLFQSLFIGLSGLFLIFESLKRLIQGSVIRSIPLGVGVMVFSLIVTLALVLRLRYVARHNGSIILDVETLHFKTDLLSNGGIILALGLVRFTGFLIWDLVVSAVIAFYVFKASLKIFRRSIDELLDHGLPVSAKTEIENIIWSYHPAISGLHNFRSRKVGEQVFLDFHVEIEGEENFQKAHDMTEGLILKIRERYPKADITVHYDPEDDSHRQSNQT